MPHRVARNDRLTVGLAAVDDNAFRAAVAVKGTLEEASRRRQIPLLAEEELDRVADAVDGAIEIHPLHADLDVGLVDMPFRGNGARA